MLPHNLARSNLYIYSSLYTLCIGANGCGKTTIIEALKFATTGQLPPGARAGHSFINDPGMTDSTEVKGCIKLRFNNAANEICILTRSLQLTKKKVKLEFRQLDGMLKIKDRTGKTSSLSYKCADLDKHMPLQLGVTSSILENVIFCHQEDSNWPMLEGAVLKKKFDDIFESSRYAKLLENINAMKKKQTSHAKDLKGDLMETSAHLNAAKGFMEEKEECEETLEELQREKEGLEELIEKVNGSMERDRQELENIQSKYREINDMRKEAENMQVSVADRKSRLGSDYDDKVSTLSLLSLITLLLLLEL